MLFLYFLLIYIFLLLFRKRESRLFSAGFSFFYLPEIPLLFCENFIAEHK